MAHEASLSNQLESELQNANSAQDVATTKMDAFSRRLREEACTIVDRHGEVATPLLMIEVLRELVDRHERHMDHTGCSYMEQLRTDVADAIDYLHNVDMSLEDIRSHVRETAN